jgi:hypothetical protein
LSEALTGILYKVESQLKVASGAIIRVGNDVVRGMVGKYLLHTHNALCRLARRSKATEVALVLTVHAHNIIEAREIFLAHLTGTVVEAIAATLTGTAHATVGQVANVP